MHRLWLIIELVVYSFLSADAAVRLAQEFQPKIESATTTTVSEEWIVEAEEIPVTDESLTD